LDPVAANRANAAPANDHPAVMLALGAEVTATGPSGERRIPISAFFTRPFEPAPRPDELLTETRVPAPAPRSGGAYVKLERKVGDFATAAVAAQITLAANEYEIADRRVGQRDPGERDRAEIRRGVVMGDDFPCRVGGAAIDR